MLPECFQFMCIMALYTRMPQFNWFSLFHRLCIYWHHVSHVLLIKRSRTLLNKNRTVKSSCHGGGWVCLQSPESKQNCGDTNFGSKWTTYLQHTEWKSLLRVSVLVNQGPRIVPLLIKLDPGLLVKSFTGLQLRCNVSFSCGSILAILSSI